MNTGTLTTMDSSSALENRTRPQSQRVWITYRFSLIICGLLWLFLSSTLCGCGSMNGYVMNRSGRKYYDKGNYEYARYEFERALMDDPHNANYAFNVARTMEHEGEYENAELMYQHALTLDPDHLPSYHALASMLREQGRTAESRELLTAWAETQPYSAGAQMAAGDMYRQEGNMSAAQNYYQQASRNVPQGRSRLQGQMISQRHYGPSGPQYATGQGYPRMASPRYPYHTPPSLQMAETMPMNDFTMMGGPVVSNQSMTSTPVHFQSPMMHEQPMMEQQIINPPTQSPGLLVPTPQQYNPTPMLNSGEPQLLPETPGSNGPQAYYPQQVVSQHSHQYPEMTGEYPVQSMPATGQFTHQVMMPTQAAPTNTAQQPPIFQAPQNMSAAPFQNISTQTSSNVMPAVQAF
ncbi:tetratricopeptide repeat protein [Thalassoglobus sp.]|uniref:tetratricopeptide repeat protein n=1 Tax=Thalassoglobus sp. TaxID=2795869 RepID=UPI003AA8C371